MIQNFQLVRCCVLLLAGSVLCPGLAEAQEKFTISGYVRDADSGEELIGATPSEDEEV